MLDTMPEKEGVEKALAFETRPRPGDVNVEALPDRVASELTGFPSFESVTRRFDDAGRPIFQCTPTGMVVWKLLTGLDLEPDLYGKFPQDDSAYGPCNVQSFADVIAQNVPDVILVRRVAMHVPTSGDGHTFVLYLKDSTSNGPIYQVLEAYMDVESLAECIEQNRTWSPVADSISAEDCSQHGFRFGPTTDDFWIKACKYTS